MNKYILGISCFYHDSSAALVNDDGIIAAAEEERFSRIKHDNSFPNNSINFLLNFAKINFNDLDAVIYYENPVIKFDRVFNRFIKNLPKSLKVFNQIANSWNEDKFWIKEIISKKYKYDKKKIFFENHHTSHASSSFFSSGFKNSATLTVDGVGEWTTSEFGTYDQNKIKKINKILFPNSLGILYSAFTEYLGFEVNEGEFKVMGLASFGEPLYIDKIEKLFLHRNEKSFEINMDYFSFENSLKTNLTNKFLNLFGEPRAQESIFLNEDQKHPLSANVNLKQKYFADIASSIQYVINDQIIKMSKYLFKETNQTNLSYSGGVAYNGVINQNILDKSGFEKIFIQPAAGDSGASIGAAQSYFSKNFKLNREKFSQKNTYLGKSYTSIDFEDCIKNYSFENDKLSDEILVNFVSDQLSKKKIFGYFDGRFEFGPRALGNRSILADPRTINMKNKINYSVKNREIFRPFAPIVIYEKALEYFEIEKKNIDSALYKYMLAVVKVKSKYVEKLQAVTHIDQTARVQILRHEDNSRLYNIIKNFGDLTGIYALVNTSFNKRGEPIVASPYDAIQTFAWSELDYLVVNNYLVSK